MSLSTSVLYVEQLITEVDATLAQLRTRLNSLMGRNAHVNDPSGARMSYTAAQIDSYQRTRDMLISIRIHLQIERGYVCFHSASDSESSISSSSSDSSSDISSASLSSASSSLLSSSSSS